MTTKSHQGNDLCKRSRRGREVFDNAMPVTIYGNDLEIKVAYVRTNKETLQQDVTEFGKRETKGAQNPQDIFGMLLAFPNSFETNNETLGLNKTLVEMNRRTW